MQFGIHPKRTVADIRKGGPKESNNNGKLIVGKDLDHFRIVSDWPDLIGRFQSVFAGPDGKVKRFKATFFFDKPAETFYYPPYIAQGEGGRRKLICNGEKQLMCRTNGVFRGANKPCEKVQKGLDEHDACPLGCRAYAELYISVPDVTDAPVAIVLTSLNEHARICALFEQLAMVVPEQAINIVPLIFERKLETITMKFKPKDGSGEQGKQEERWMVNVSIDPEWPNPFRAVMPQIRAAQVLEKYGLPYKSVGALPAPDPREGLAAGLPVDEELESAANVDDDPSETNELLEYTEALNDWGIYGDANKPVKIGDLRAAAKRFTRLAGKAGVINMTQKSLDAADKATPAELRKGMANLLEKIKEYMQNGGAEG